MKRRLIGFCFLALIGVACQSTPPADEPSRTPAQPLPPVETVSVVVPPPPSSAPSAAAPPVASSAPMSVGSGPVPPYPEAWRSEAEVANRENSCQELVYKRGCAEIRTGRVTAEVTLKPDGKVDRVKLIDNAIRHEPEVVWRCLRQKLLRWKFHPPDGVSSDVQVTVVLSDMC